MKGFAFTFEEVSLGCGGNVQLTDNAPTTITQSPNFPQIPPPFTECEWVFTAPQGEAVQVTFQVSFDFTYSPGYVTINLYAYCQSKCNLMELAF